MKAGKAVQHDVLSGIGPNDDGLSSQNDLGEKLQKVMAQAGFGSRRLMEEWIAAGRVSVNGEPATLGMRVVDGDMIKAERRILRVGERDRSARVLLYHKPDGQIVSRDDPEKRSSVFDKLPKLRAQKWIAIGRLDFNTSGLLIFTTSGELANRLMHPRFEVEREYAVRVQGKMTEAQIEKTLKHGVELEDGLVKFDKLNDEGGEGYNHWYRVILREGRNRVVRRTFDTLGLPVSRLMRVRFGIIGLPPRLKRGMSIELDKSDVGKIMDWAGIASNHDLQQDASVCQLDQSPSTKPVSRPAVPARGIGRANPARARKSKTGAKR
jgi:23S rRNA pseudouridine2605 synthase